MKDEENRRPSAETKQEAYSRGAFLPSKLPGNEGVAEHVVRGVTGDEGRGGRAVFERAQVGHQAVAVSLAGASLGVQSSALTPSVRATRGVEDGFACFVHGHLFCETHVSSSESVCRERTKAESDVKQTAVTCSLGQAEEQGNECEQRRIAA